MPSYSRTRNVGVMALARELGVTHGAISHMMSRGMTREDIVREYAHRGNQYAQSVLTSGSKPIGSKPVGSMTTVPAAGGYRPRNAKLASSRPAPGSVVTSPPTVSLQTSTGSSSPTVVELEGQPHGGALKRTRLTYEQTVVREQEKESLAQASIRKEIALADLRELEIAQKRGELAIVGVLNRWFAGCIRKFSDRAGQIGPELADRLAAESDPVKCADMVTLELRRMLEHLRLYNADSVLKESEQEAA